MPGADQAIKAAAKSGWEAALLAVIVISIAVLCGYLIKHILADGASRENRLSLRITSLETYVETTLKDTLEKCTIALVNSNSAVSRLTEVVEKLAEASTERPCFWSAEKQKEIMRDLNPAR